MPPTIPNQQRERWLTLEIERLRNDIAGLKKPGTQYVVDPNGVCQAIWGWLEFDHNGNATGLGNVWGIASFATGAWVRL